METKRNPTDEDSRAANRGEVGAGEAQLGRSGRALLQTAGRPPDVISAPPGLPPPPAWSAPPPPGLGLPARPPRAAPCRRPRPSPPGIRRCFFFSIFTSEFLSPRIGQNLGRRGPRVSPAPGVGAAAGTGEEKSKKGRVGAASDRQTRSIFLEVFAGHATLSAAVRDEGLEIGMPIEIRRGRHHDLSDRRLQRFVKAELRRGKIWALHLATPCTVWSVARRTGTSSTNWGTSLATFTRAVLRLCRKHGVLFTLENPLSSGLFRWKPIRRELERAEAEFIRYDNCAYGANYLKPTCIATNIPEMSQLSRLCPGKHYHEHLER